jgi:hypothetical protein
LVSDRASFPLASQVELTEPYPAEECLPLVPGVGEDTLAGVAAVADLDAAVGQELHFDAVAVREAEGGLDPPAIVIT